MNKNLVQKLSAFSLAFFVLLSASGFFVKAADIKESDFTLLPEKILQASSSDLENDEKQGSITIELTDGEKGSLKDGVKFAYTHIADIENGSYRLMDDYQSAVDLNNIRNAEELEDAAERLNERVMKADGNVITDKNGVAVIEDLKVGVYLLTVEDQANYEMVAPVLLSIPTWNEVDGKMMYDVKVIPKHTPNVKEELQEEIPNAPQTNVENRTGQYLGIAAILLIISVIIFAFNNKKQKLG